MPQLITFVLCDRCLVTSEGTASLIVLMQKVSVTLRTDATKKKGLPANAVGPTNWCAYSLWKSLPGEHGVEFSKVIQILWPDKSEFLKRSIQFCFQEEKSHNVLLNIMGFPIGQIGEVIVNMWLERDSQRIGEIHSWAVEVEHKLYDANEQEIKTIG